MTNISLAFHALVSQGARGRVSGGNLPQVLGVLDFSGKKAEHLYSTLHGIQTTLKRSGMDHTAFNLQRTPCQPLPRKRSPDGASNDLICFQGLSRT